MLANADPDKAARLRRNLEALERNEGVPGRVFRAAKAGTVSPASVLRAVIAYEAVGLCLFLGAWSACYAARPSRALFNSAALRRSAPGLRARGERLAGRVRASRAYGVVSRWVSERTAVAYAEGTVLNQLAAPVTVPLKLWVAWRVVQFADGGGLGGDGGELPAAPDGAVR